MKQSVYKYDFHRAFSDMGRSNNFSYKGLDLLYEYFENLEDDTGEEIELDVIAICCEYTEEEAVNIASNYNIDISEYDASENQEEDIFTCVLDYLEKHTSVVGHFDTTIIYQDF